jgi:hypothetical protein
MHPVLRAVTVCSVLFSLLCRDECRAAPYSNVLINAGFESGSSDTDFAPWSQYGNAFRYAISNCHGGAYAVSAWGNWWPEGEWNISGVVQEVPAESGQLWEAAVWMMIPPDNPLQGQAQVLLTMEFLNEQQESIYLSTAQKRLDQYTATGVWQRLTVRAETTEQTAYVRIKPYFLQSPAFESGAVYLDDCALYQVPFSTLKFAGRRWQRYDGVFINNINYCTTNNVYVDEKDRLHITLLNSNSVWYSGGVKSQESLGFGEYRWYLDTRIDALDPNLVLGLFTYEEEEVFGTNHNEIDIEITAAFDGMQTNSISCTIQPYTIPDHVHQIPLDRSCTQTTHRFIWRPDEVRFQSYTGHSREPASSNDIISEWTFDGHGIPVEGNDKTHMNLWLFFTNRPALTQHTEVIIKDFDFIPYDGYMLCDTFSGSCDTQTWTSFGPADPTAGVLQTNGLLQLSPGSNTMPCGYRTDDTIHCNERGVPHVFSAQLDSFTVLQEAPGEDGYFQLALSSSTGGAFASAHAIRLRGGYYAETDVLDITCFIKSNDPFSDGTSVFVVTLSDLSTCMNTTKGLNFRLLLNRETYGFEIHDDAGRVIGIQTNQGTAFGPHGLNEQLCYGYWSMAAANSHTASSWTTSWSDTRIGVQSAPEPPSPTLQYMPNQQAHISWPASFDKTYDVYRTSSLTNAFTAIVTNFRPVTPSVTLTDRVDQLPTALYRVRER